MCRPESVDSFELRCRRQVRPVLRAMKAGAIARSRAPASDADGHFVAIVSPPPEI
jgi:hypothetical protein